MIDPNTKVYAAPVGDEGPHPATSHAIMLELVGCGKRVLEFGCAGGYMSRWLVAAGNRVTGVEIDPSMAEEARAFCEEVVVADLDARRVPDLFPEALFDVAIFGDVLEHVRDPWRVLEETRAVLGPGGSVVISIPNVAHGNVRLSLLAGNFDYQELGILDNTHLRFFTLKTVKELCTRAGYAIERIDRTKAELFASIDAMPALNPKDFDPEVIAEVRRDPEHDTFQFVLLATPLSDENRLRDTLELYGETAQKLGDATKRVATLEALLAEFREGAEVGREREMLLVERSMAAEALGDRVRMLEERGRSLEDELARCKSDFDESAALFLAYANAEVEAVRAEMARVNGAIAAVQKSPIWRFKLGLGALRKRLRTKGSN